MATVLTRRLPAGATELPSIPPAHFAGASVAVALAAPGELEAQGILALRGKKHTAQVRRARAERARQRSL